MTSFYLSKPYEPPQAPLKLPLSEPWALFGGISPNQFMARYWHKKPLLIRGAIPAFALSAQSGEQLDSPIPAQELLKFALQDQVESRLVKSKPWSFSSGPFVKKSIPSLDKPNWTLLLQGMEARHPAAAKILSWFRFIPDARLDDLMVSIAGIGGGVGPHFDSYDVFLIQMSGRRQWRISEQEDLSLNPNLPLKILQNFKLEQEWTLEPGDMLYLPPHVAHDGIALDAGCQTWSVGFRSPSFKELLQEGLWRLAESLEDIPALENKFADPKQNATQLADQLPDELIKQLESKLKGLKLDQIDGFLPGITAYLSEPKQQAFFDGPEDPLNPGKFLKKLGATSLIPHPQTRILALGKQIYCNGENMTKGQAPDIISAWQGLSAQKGLKTNKLKHLDKSSLYVAYLAGWLVFQT
ncbi:cupin domain-containing protein [Polynucleobacter sp. JS-Safj-400b-B2]|uniref:cupin domain-containing protein n=1 Tax=Polynucleobacter sp. JS-Safj-400b-B2 TaxID=2576921 RepID=UPI001C0C066E|nr:cupin domain-containing protein [Polynucleobacter sp. JS-Safj-400b-B2]MBU3626787.1 cupin domain-containing protein [Polynucleobacter sp. JS-Safj-400b-B2]